MIGSTVRILDSAAAELAEGQERDGLEISLIFGQRQKQ
jgi:hypothetical protein